MKKLFLLFCFSLTFNLLAQTADEIIKKSDAIRNPDGPFEMSVVVTNSEDKSKSEFEVLIGGPGKTLIKTVAPIRDKGRSMLMLDENMWVFIPNLNRSVRISLSQKLTGQAANGDIARMRWAGDYSATIEKEDATSWTIFLKAVKKGLTYDQMRVLIEKGTFRPQSANYLTLSGAPLKSAIFSDYKELAGALRPSKITISDISSKNKSSEIVITKMQSKQLNDSIFNRNNLK